MAKLRSGREDRGTPIKIAYPNSVHEAVLREQSWLESEQWEPFRFFGQRNAISFWSSADGVSQ